MRHFTAPRRWFILAGVLAVLSIFVVGGAAGGLLAAAAIATFIIGAFISLRGESPEDRTAGAGIFGGWF